MELTRGQIPELASRFANLTFDPHAKREIELFGAAFVWSDERPNFDELENTIHVTRFFQYLLWYRKSLIEQMPNAKFTEYWDAFRDACPTWPGFRPERCDPSLRGDLDAAVSATMSKLERAFDVCDRKRRPDHNENAR